MNYRIEEGEARIPLTELNRLNDGFKKLEQAEEAFNRERKRVIDEWEKNCKEFINTSGIQYILVERMHWNNSHHFRSSQNYYQEEHEKALLETAFGEGHSSLDRWLRTTPRKTLLKALFSLGRRHI